MLWTANCFLRPNRVVICIAFYFIVKNIVLSHLIVKIVWYIGTPCNISYSYVAETYVIYFDE